MTQEIARSAWMKLLELFEIERPHFLAQLSELEVNPIDLGILKEIGDHDQHISMQDLFVCRLHDRSSVTRFVDRLVQRGWVERRENPGDRRRKLLCLTEVGTETLARLLSHLSHPPPSVACLPAEDIEALARIASRAVEYAREHALQRTRSGTGTAPGPSRST